VWLSTPSREPRRADYLTIEDLEKSAKLDNLNLDDAVQTLIKDRRRGQEGAGTTSTGNLGLVTGAPPFLLPPPEITKLSVGAIPSALSGSGQYAQV
jgi:hypothetical protein